MTNPEPTADREALVERMAEAMRRHIRITHNTGPVEISADPVAWHYIARAALAVVEAEQGADAALQEVIATYPLYDEQGTRAIARDGCCPHPMMDRVHVTRGQCDHDCHDPLVSFATTHELVRIAFERGRADEREAQGARDEPLRQALERILMFEHAESRCRDETGRALCQSNMHGSFEIARAALATSAAPTQETHGD